MTVKELRTLLLNCDDEQIVLMLGTETAIMPVKVDCIRNWNCNGSNYVLILHDGCNGAKLTDSMRP